MQMEAEMLKVAGHVRHVVELQLEQGALQAAQLVPDI
jgi:hypothetical protein